VIFNQEICFNECKLGRNIQNLFIFSLFKWRIKRTGTTGKFEKLIENEDKVHITQY